MELLLSVTWGHQDVKECLLPGRQPCNDDKRQRYDRALPLRHVVTDMKGVNKARNMSNKAVNSGLLQRQQGRAARRPLGASCSNWLKWDPTALSVLTLRVICPG